MRSIALSLALGLAAAGGAAAQDVNLDHAAEVITYLTREAEACRTATERIVVDCRSAPDLVAHAGRLIEDLEVARTSMLEQRDLYLRNGEQALANLMTTEAQAARSRTAQAVANGISVIYKAVGLSADLAAAWRGAGRFGADPAQWTLSNAQLSRIEEIAGKIRDLSLLAETATGAVEQATAIEDAPASVFDLGTVKDAAELANVALDFHERFGTDIRRAMQNPAARSALLGVIAKVGDYLVKTQQVERAAYLAELERIAGAEFRNIRVQAGAMADLNRDMARARELGTEVEALVVALRACLARQCTGAEIPTVPASATARVLPEAAERLRARLNLLADRSLAIRAAQPQAPPGQCESLDGWRARNREVAEAQLVDLTNRRRDLSLEQEAMDDAFRLAVRDGKADAAREARARIQTIRAEIEGIDTLREAIRLRLSADPMNWWARGWQTSWGPVRISRTGGSFTITVDPEGHLFRGQGRYIVTQATSDSITGEWVMQNPDRHGAFHWCRRTDVEGFDIFRREDAPGPTGWLPRGRGVLR